MEFLILVFQTRHFMLKYLTNTLNIFKKKHILNKYKRFIVIFCSVKLLHLDIRVAFTITMLSFCLLHEVNGILINDHLSNLSALSREKEREERGGEKEDGCDMTSLTMHKRRFPRSEKAYSCSGELLGSLETFGQVSHQRYSMSIRNTS